MKRRFLWLTPLLLWQASSLSAQIAVSANDGKQRAADAPDEPLVPDTVSILDISGLPIRLLGTLHAPASLIGPPASVALTHDGRFAIITAAQALDASGTLAPASTVTLIGLDRHGVPRVLQATQAGIGASGVAINPTGTLVLVANSGGDSVSIFAVASHRLTPAGTLALDPKSKPLDVAFSADGSEAYVVAQGSGTLVRLSIAGKNVTRAGGDIALGVQPYSLSLNAAAKIAYISNLGGRSRSATPGPKIGTISIVDLDDGHMVGQVDAGVGPEHIALSPDGHFLEANMVNGSSGKQSSPNFHEHGLMVVYRVDGTSLSPVAHIDTGRWCQGAVWSGDGKRIFLQCAASKQIEAYEFSGTSLAADAAATIQLDARPGAIATVFGR